MPYDYRKLLGKITEKYEKRYAFAAAIGWSERTCSLKLNGKKQWKQSEMSEACKLLDIPVCDIATYFFTQKVLR